MEFAELAKSRRAAPKSSSKSVLTGVAQTHGYSTADVECLPRDKARAVIQQIGCGVGNVLGLPHSFDRNTLYNLDGFGGIGWVA